VLAALAASLSAAPALATQGMLCSAMDGGAEISMALGNAGGLAVVGASLRVDDQSWVSDAAYGEGTPFTIGQRFSDASGMKVDFFDEFVNEKVAELRLSHAEEDGDFVLAGTLRVVGAGAWAVSCEEQ
jgi:hypothetical protein